MKIYQTAKHFAAHSLPPGTLVTDRKTYLDVAVADGYLRLLSLCPAGKKRMSAADFLRGFKHTEGATFE
jgi:methionyl-tRNA formyltransferase